MHQEALQLLPLGWLDDWIFFTSSAAEALRVLDRVHETLAPAGWEVKWGKLEILCNCGRGGTLQVHNHVIQMSSHMKWLGCVLSEDASATAHLESRAAIAMGAWNILRQHFALHRLGLRIRIRLYQQIFVPTLCHAIEAFVLTSSNWAYLAKVQNQIQRGFIKVQATSMSEHWRLLHSTLRALREEGAVFDVLPYVVNKALNHKHKRATRKLLAYRDEAWQRKFQAYRPRRTRGKPSQTLLQYQATLRARE